MSDIVIYRTRAERLHNDLFYFLGDASKAYNKHFSHELSRVGEQNSFVSGGKTPEDDLSSLGPAVVIFHETLHTDVLSRVHSKEPEVVIRERFRALKQDISAFSKIRYVGTRSAGKTNFRSLREVIAKELRDVSVRSQRKVCLVYQVLNIVLIALSFFLSNISI